MKENAQTILVVDDQEVNRLLLADLVASLGYRCLTAGNGAGGLALLESETVDLVLLDIMMPMMTGHEMLESMMADEGLRHIPVIVVSGLDEMDSIVRCVQAGADDYLIKPFNATLLRARIQASLEKKRLYDQDKKYRVRIENYNEELEHRVKQAVHEVSSTQLATIFAMSKLAESRDPETGEHLERMREYARLLAESLRHKAQYQRDLDETVMANLYATAPLHDIGKVGIPDRILQKPGRLTADEFEIIKQHTVIGADTLRAVDNEHPGNDFIRIGIEVALTHHERWDGTGYPRGLAGEEIPPVGRILALADVYDALTSKRCYKEASSHEESVAIILEGSGSHFDPGVVDVFRQRQDDFVAIRQEHLDTEKVLLT